MGEADQPPSVPPSWQAALRWRQVGQEADGFAQSILEKMANKVWVGQDEIDPPGLSKDVQSARERGALYIVLNMLADVKIIASQRGYAPIPGRRIATEYRWFRLTWWGKFFRRWPASRRQIFLGLVLLVRRYGRLVRQVISLASIVVALIKGWNRDWTDVVLALTVFGAIIGGRRRPPISPNMMDT
jgi:hypothetical protein